MSVLPSRPQLLFHSIPHNSTNSCLYPLNSCFNPRHSIMLEYLNPLSHSMKPCLLQLNHKLNKPQPLPNTEEYRPAKTATTNSASLPLTSSRCTATDSTQPRSVSANDASSCLPEKDLKYKCFSDPTAPEGNYSLDVENINANIPTQRKTSVAKQILYLSQSHIMNPSTCPMYKERKHP